MNLTSVQRVQAQNQVVLASMRVAQALMRLVFALVRSASFVKTGRTGQTSVARVAFLRVSQLMLITSKTMEQGGILVENERNGSASLFKQDTHSCSTAFTGICDKRQSTRIVIPAKAGI